MDTEIRYRYNAMLQSQSISHVYMFILYISFKDINLYVKLDKCVCVLSVKLAKSNKRKASPY